MQMTDTAIEDVMSLSPLQKGLFSRGVLRDADGADPYVITMAADVSGPLDVALLRQCVGVMLVRHPNLRVSFAYHDLPHPVQIVPSHAEPPWRHVRTTPERLAAVEADERQRPFELENGPLIRFLLVEMSSQSWRFVITAHHIVIDGWSLPLLVAEVLTLYQAGGDTYCLGPAPRPYRDYIGWLARRDGNSSAQLWRGYLADLPGPTLLSPALALEEPRGLATRSEIVLGRTETESIVAAARVRGITLSTVLQLAWAVVLARFTDRDDVVFGVTVSGRPPELSAVETMVGLFINTIPLRVRVDPDIPVARLCESVQRDAARLRDHSHLTHAELRSLGGVGEMFDTLLVYENFPPGTVVGRDEFRAGAVTFRPAALESLAHFPITIAGNLMDGRLHLMVEAVEHALGVTDPRVLGRRLAATVTRLLAQWDRRVGDIDVLMPGETLELRDAVGVASSGGFTDRLAEVAAANPDVVALSWSDGQLSYCELDAAVESVAARLAALGVGPEVPAAVRLRRGLDYVVAMLAVLRAGGVCVPLEIDTPEDRVCTILRQTGAAVLVDKPIQPMASESRLQRSQAHLDQAAYIVFTSGTTGEPKGVIGTNRALLAYAQDHVERVLRPAANRLGRRLRVAHTWSFAFDAAWQPLAALLEGHTVHIVDERDRRDAEALVEIFKAHRIDMLDTTPSMFGQLRTCGLLDEVPLAVLALGGEALGPKAWTDIGYTCSNFGMDAFNCYGPTETTVEAVVAAVSDHEIPMIGDPTRGMSVMVLDSRLRPAPEGAVGELYLAGDQLTRGYVGRPAETALRYVAISDGRRMYRTGDLVRCHPGRALQFLGRADSQVKVRGYRVEPAEIEAALVAQAAVGSACVLADEGPTGPKLVAFVTGAVAVPELRAMLRERLPRYMMPHRIVIVDDIPLTSNGKPDAAVLRARHTGPTHLAEPETETEKLLTQVLLELLGQPVDDVDADLLQLGLDSISALSVVQAVRQRGVPLRARMIAGCASLRELAAAVDAAPQACRGDAGGAPSDQAIPLLPAARWLYDYGDPRRLAQTTVLRLPAGVTAVQIQAMLNAVVAAHPILRCQLDRVTMTMTPACGPAWPVNEAALIGDEFSAISRHAAEALETIDPENGSLLAAVWLRAPQRPGILILTTHVLAMDPASWRVVIAELDAGWRSIESGDLPSLPGEHTTYRAWANHLLARSAQIDTLGFWTEQLDGDDPLLGARRVDPTTDLAGDLVLSMTIADDVLTAALLQARSPLQHVLIAATLRTVSKWRLERGQSLAEPLLALETHGRADSIVADCDTSDTVGLLTSIYPLRFGPHGTLDDVAERLAAVPGEVLDYGLLRYLSPTGGEHLRRLGEPQILLNYLGRTDIDNHGPLRISHQLSAAAPAIPEPNAAVRHELWLVAGIMRVDGGLRLAVQWRTMLDIFSRRDVERLQAIWSESLQTLADEMAR